MMCYAPVFIDSAYPVISIAVFFEGGVERLLWRIRWYDSGGTT